MLVAIHGWYDKLDDLETRQILDIGRMEIELAYSVMPSSNNGLTEDQSNIYNVAVDKYDRLSLMSSAMGIHTSIERFIKSVPSGIQRAAGEVTNFAAGTVSSVVWSIVKNFWWILVPLILLLFFAPSKFSLLKKVF